jgi:hypothetical protein
MKHTYYILLALCAAVLVGFSSCKRRPLTTADYKVIVNIEIEEDIVNYKMPHQPSLMRCIFYDSHTGAFVTQAFLPSTGGQVNLIPSREYDVLVYNFDTESTWINEENSFNKIFASTSVIPTSFLTKLRSRSAASEKEKIVYDPDHLYVGRLNDVFVPARSVDADPLVLDIKCETVVESWILEVRSVTGVENIGSVAAVITGLAESNKIAFDELSTNFVSVYFDNQVIDENGLLTARFNTFGANPLSGTTQVLSLVFIDIAGNGRVFNIDVSDQFIDNPEQIIRINTEIDIPKPITAGDGGFAPEVDEWNDVNTEIII